MALVNFPRSQYIPEDQICGMEEVVLLNVGGVVVVGQSRIGAENKGVAKGKENPVGLYLLSFP